MQESYIYTLETNHTSLGDCFIRVRGRDPERIIAVPGCVDMGGRGMGGGLFFVIHVPGNPTALLQLLAHIGTGCYSCLWGGLSLAMPVKLFVAVFLVRLFV